ncbi:Type 1 phosphatases regulator ypi1 [Tulasnella sp. 419]|nr:Type 1 phosphatases regulator ypi1 [Tulasnella sp. 418]KAG8967342.1 Type 1 phosphatases regulator ypi1 [Tulasnella sp. 419]
MSASGHLHVSSVTTQGSHTSTTTSAVSPATEVNSTENTPDTHSEVSGVLRLRGGPRSRPQVAWEEGVVDNEGCGKKKSKICCIYHKPRPFDESSDESDASSDEPQSQSSSRQKPTGNSEEPNAYEARRKGKTKR